MAKKKAFGVMRTLPPVVLRKARAARKWAKANSPTGGVEGMCIYASEHLVDLLHEVGIKAKTQVMDFLCDHGPEYHVVVVFQGCILDVTGDQFNEYCSKVAMRAIVYGSPHELGRRYSRGITS